MNITGYWRLPLRERTPRLTRRRRLAGDRLHLAGTPHTDDPAPRTRRLEQIADVNAQRVGQVHQRGEGDVLDAGLNPTKILVGHAETTRESVLGQPLISANLRNRLPSGFLPPKKEITWNLAPSWRMCGTHVCFFSFMGIGLARSFRFRR